MKVRVALGKAGRIEIPKPLRRELHVEPGDALEMENAREQIILRPVRGTGIGQVANNLTFLETLCRSIVLSTCVS